jgi:hypothetical protein
VLGEQEPGRKVLGGQQKQEIDGVECDDVPLALITVLAMLNDSNGCMMETPIWSL